MTWSVVASALAVVVSCAEPTDELMGGRGGAGGSRGATTNSEIGSDSTAGGAAAAANARALFDALEPKLAQSCGPCHVSGSSSAPIWLGPPAYDTIKAYKGIVVADPASSIILTKPQHIGSAMPAALVPDVTSWLTAESTLVTAAPSSGGETTAFALPNGDGGIDLPGPGGRVTFNASIAGGILTLKTVQLVAPAGTAVHASGVHIDIVHTGGAMTRDDTLAAADSTAPKAGSVALGIGLVILPRVANDDQLKFSFDVLEASAGVVTTTVGGCKSVASFQTNAVPAIQNNTCMTCHNTGGSGFGSLDLSALAATPPDFAKACGQAKSRIDTANVAQSGIIIAPTGGVNAHPFKNADANYKTQMTTWINAEK